jgi:transcriptional regulator with XRE-family HTH domain
MGVLKDTPRNLIRHTMSDFGSTSSRFKKFRGRSGLSHEEAARQMDITPPSVWDLESYEDELCTVYSPAQVQRFARVLGIRPIEFFGEVPTEPPVTAAEVASLIRERCRSRKMSLEQFEDAAGWSLSECLEPPERLLENVSVDGLQDICRELDIDWRRVVFGL